ncbi:MAG: hypothetical protein J0I20_13410 [Chloroflexi bacterium]|nr:hypothetical protein [Chloroflexota bacterium]OJV92856.1 MAG: hypothetical protein BGO39_30340 [Chloroflexi bacterium 54-19]
MGNFLPLKAAAARLLFVALLGLGCLLANPQFVHAGPVKQTVADKVVDTLKTAFNNMDLNACLALMTDDAMVLVVNPSDLATGTLTKDTLTYTGKQGAQSEVANFFSINFTNGFTIWSTNFKTTDSSFSGPMQLAIRDFVIETDVQATLEGGKIKKLVITDKSISKKSAPVPSNAPSTGVGGESASGNQSPLLVGGFIVFALSGLGSLTGLVILSKKEKRARKL